MFILQVYYCSKNIQECTADILHIQEKVVIRQCLIQRRPQASTLQLHKSR